MRLEPVEKPRGLMMRLAYWGTRRQFGKVMTPMSVVLARMPGSLKVTGAIGKFENKKIHLDQQVHYLVAAHTAQLNGCGFCADLARWMFLKAHLGMEKLNALSEYRTSPLFSERERAALAYAEEATRNKQVADATFEELRRHFSDQEIVEITWVNAAENYYNLLNVPLEIGADGLCAIAQAKEYRAHRESGAAARERTA